MQKMAINLWFDKNAEEAVNFYLSIFKKSKIISVTHYSKEGFEYHGMPEGTVMTIEFELNGQGFIALNGGPLFKFNEAISFIINCETQKEIDYYWEKLTDGGEEVMCGWLKDRFGISWQVVPTGLGKLINSNDKERSSRAMNAMMKMKKLDLNELQKAFEGK